MKLSFVPGQLEALRTKLAAPNINSIKFGWRIDLLTEYSVKVAHMMGSVSGRGGYPSIEIQGTKITGTDHWNALQPYTIFKKMGVDYSAAKMETLYSKYTAQTTIWEDTGTTKSHVTVNQNFAGIISDFAKKLEEGGENEEGYKIRPRPLFAVANYLVRGLIHKACSNPNDPLGNRMRKEFKDAIGWGK